jgi:hypothetical protein
MTAEDQKNHLAKPKSGLPNHSQGLLSGVLNEVQVSIAPY